MSEKKERKQIYLVVEKDDEYTMGNNYKMHRNYYTSDKYLVGRILEQDQAHVFTFPQMHECSKVYFTITDNKPDSD